MNQPRTPLQRSVFLCRAYCALILLSGSVQADELGITIQPETRQTWGGFGVSQVAYSGRDQEVYELTPDDKLREMEDLIYRDLQVQVLRMWMGPGADPAFYRTLPEAPDQRSRTGGEFPSLHPG